MDTAKAKEIKRLLNEGVWIQCETEDEAEEMARMGGILHAYGRMKWPSTSTATPSETVYTIKGGIVCRNCLAWAKGKKPEDTVVKFCDIVHTCNQPIVRAFRALGIDIYDDQEFTATHVSLGHMSGVRQRFHDNCRQRAWERGWDEVMDEAGLHRLIELAAGRPECFTVHPFPDHEPEPIRWTEDEAEAAEHDNHRFGWVARDDSESVYLYENEPDYDGLEFLHGGRVLHIDPDDYPSLPKQQKAKLSDISVTW